MLPYDSQNLTSNQEILIVRSGIPVIHDGENVNVTTPTFTMTPAGLVTRTIAWRSKPIEPGRYGSVALAHNNFDTDTIKGGAADGD